MVFGFSLLELATALAAFLVGGLITSALAASYLVSIRDDHFVRDIRDQGQQRHSRIQRIVIMIGRNLAGVALIVIGIILSLPGVPGQGLLTMLVGLLLLDFPGKPRLERRLLGRPAIIHAVNRLRERVGRKPLLYPGLNAKERASTNTHDGPN